MTNKFEIIDVVQQTMIDITSSKTFYNTKYQTAKLFIVMRKEVYLAIREDSEHLGLYNDKIEYDGMEVVIIDKTSLLTSDFNFDIGWKIYMED